MVKKIVIFVNIVIILFLSYLQWGREVRICNSRSMVIGEYYTESITIVANTLYIGNREEFAKRMIQKCIDNSFKEIKFLYGTKYPNELTIIVYLNKISWKQGNESFRIYFVQNDRYGYRYNIRDNPEKFTIEIR